jgi:hypothetical protein
MDTEVAMEKSSRHSKIIGDFGEKLICNWLSRSGFEIIIVDHTGIDLLAYKKEPEQRLGITVKSRTRVDRKEKEPVFIFEDSRNDEQKVTDACQAFACEPWIGIYVETTDYGELYLTSLQNYNQKYRGKPGRAYDAWKMTPVYCALYEKDEEVKHIKIDFHPTNWKW